MQETPHATRAVMACAAAVVVLMLVVAVVVSARVAVLGMAGVVYLAAAMRAFAPSAWAFGVRDRGTDVTVMLVLAVAATVLGVTTNLD